MAAVAVVAVVVATVAAVERMVQWIYRSIAFSMQQCT